MKEYLDFWRNYTNFTGCTTRRGYWIAYLINFVISFALGYLFGNGDLAFIASLYSLAALIPGLAISIRRLRDAGYRWTSLLWSFLPIVGTIIVLVRLCKPTNPNYEV